MSDIGTDEFVVKLKLFDILFITAENEFLLVFFFFLFFKQAIVWWYSFKSLSTSADSVAADDNAFKLALNFVFSLCIVLKSSFLPWMYLIFDGQWCGRYNSSWNFGEYLVGEDEIGKGEGNGVEWKCDGEEIGEERDDGRVDGEGNKEDDEWEGEEEWERERGEKTGWDFQ